MSHRAFRVLGLALTGTGAAHFAAPAAFEPVSRLPFPEDTRRWVYRNGATEVAIGLAISATRTRGLGLAALAVYGGWLAARVAANR